MLVHQCSRHRDTLYHEPSKVPDDYFASTFSSTSPTKPQSSKTMKSLPKKADHFKLAMPIRMKSLGRPNKESCAKILKGISQNTPPKAQKKPEPDSSFDRRDYKAWEAGLTSPDKKFLNSTQISIGSNQHFN